MGAVRRTTRRRVGANCSPRSSAAGSRWTGLVGTTNADCTSTCLLCISSASVVVFLPIVVQLLLLSVMMVAPAVRIDEVAGPICAQASSILTNRSWMGYEFDSTLGFPGEGPPIEVPPAELVSEATEAWLDTLEEEKRLIEQFDVVKSIDFIIGETANLTKVKATLWCCWEASRRTFKQIHEACTEDDRKPSLLEASRALHAALLEKHGGNGHVWHPRAVERRALLAQEGATRALPPSSACPLMTDCTAWQVTWRWATRPPRSIASSSPRPDRAAQTGRPRPPRRRRSWHARRKARPAQRERPRRPRPRSFEQKRRPCTRSANRTRSRKRRPHQHPCARPLLRAPLALGILGILGIPWGHAARRVTPSTQGAISLQGVPGSHLCATMPHPRGSWCRVHCPYGMPPPHSPLPGAPLSGPPPTPPTPPPPLPYADMAPHCRLMARQHMPKPVRRATRRTSPTT